MRGPIETNYRAADARSPPPPPPPPPPTGGGGGRCGDGSLDMRKLRGLNRRVVIPDAQLRIAGLVRLSPAEAGLGVSPPATQTPPAHFSGRVSSEAIHFDQNTP